MRRVTAGLGSLVIAAGLATTVALTRARRRRTAASGQPQAVGRRRCRTRPRRSGGSCARSRSRRCSAGEREGRSSAARSKVVKVGKTAPRTGARGRGPVRRARAREDGQDLRRAGRVRQRAAPELPGPGHGPEHAGPGDVRRAAAQRDPGAGPHEGQLDGLAAGLQPRSTSRSMYFGDGAATSRSRRTTSSSRRAATASTARSPTG